MAGIGFRLEKILQGDTYVDSVKAHFYSAIICSGPWILSILTLFFLNYFSPKNIDPYEILYFRSILVYVFAFSLIFSGVMYLSVTRYISDKLYIRDFDSLVPIFNSSTLVLLVFQTLIGGAYVHALSGSLIEKILILMIYLTISMIWLIMIFLTALKDYRAIGLAYAFGSAVTILSSVWLGKVWGLQGYFAGYFFGHFLIVILLSARIFIEFPTKRMFDAYIMNIFWKYRYLVWIGFLYNLAIWIDKIVFWFSPRGIEVAQYLYAYPSYDSAVFFAYLTIIPAMSIFMIQIETDFYKSYRHYYGEILNKITYSDIQKNKKRLMQSLQNGFVKVMVFQGIITLLSVVFSARLVEALHLQSAQIPIFRITLLGAFLHSLLLIVIIMILYFDFQKLALAVTIMFVLTNGLFTYVTHMSEISFLGYGYFFSTLLTLAVSFYALDYRVRRLEYLTFATQPVAMHREEEVV